MLTTRPWAWLVVMAVAAAVRAEEWPTFRHDNHRSGKTAERLSAASLRRQWTWQSAGPPQPAWAGPAKWDAFANLKPLRSMRNYDPVFHPIVAGGSVYFGSSVDDSVHCLDAASGKQKWSFTTDGPVRIAPAQVDGRLYFGSDDGRAYCLRADDGGLVWKHSPVPATRRIINNGRLISLWPCRTGVLVAGDTAYYGAGMLPWEPSYLCAVDARTGKVHGPGRYVKRQSGVTMEGALLASQRQLLSPQGRVPPLLFDRADGKPLGSLDGKGGGGCFVLVTDDDRVLHGPGNKTGWISESNAQSRQRLASFNGGNEIVVDGDTAYLLTDYRLAALDRRTKKTRWSKPCEYPYALILAGDTLFAGGRDAVAAFRAKDGKLLWEGEVPGKAYGLAVAGGRLLVGTDEGAVCCFQPGRKLPPAETVTVTTQTNTQRPGQLPPAKKAEPITLAVGPYLQFTGPDAAIVRWQTQQASPTILEYGCAENREDVRKIENAVPKTRHRAKLDGLRHNTVYWYTVKAVVAGRVRATAKYECDTFFNYSPSAVADVPGWLGSQDATGRLCARAAEHVLSASGVGRGICLVLGSGDGRLAYQLARRSRLRVIGVDTDAHAVAAARRRLKRAGIYGSRVSIHQVDSLDSLPFVGGFANLIVSQRVLDEGECVGTAAEVSRLLQPAGMALLGQPPGWPHELSKAGLETWCNADGVSATIRQDEHGLWAQLVGQSIPGSGVWSHQYGLPDNSAYGGESLQGARTSDDLQVQWIGRPGPRAQADRNGRKPSPLSTGGRLFMQGLHRMIALDAYNGTILWSLEIPQFERFNVPRDCSNWCADQRHVFAAIGDKCWRIDAADGTVSKLYPVIAGPKRDWNYDWGYVASHASSIIGSAVKQGTSWTNFFGGAGWYDSKDGPATHKICSDSLFSLDKHSGEVRWTYEQGLVINPTITIGQGRVYFVECRNPKVIASDPRRVGMGELWQDQFLVALEVDTGRKQWEVPLDTADGLVVFYLAYGDGRLVLVSSDQKYHAYAFDAVDGSPQWDLHFDWPGEDHGKHMSRPAIVGGNVLLRPAVIDLATGRLRQTPMPDGGCGTYAATERMAVFRNGNLTLWDIQGNKTSSWNRLRPGCWLSTIPAAGMLLSPEAGGGCSCGNWMETSMAFKPKRSDH